MEYYKLVLIVFLLIRTSTPEEDDYESILTEFDLEEYDLIDAYDDISHTSKNVLLGVQTFEEKIKLELQRGTIMRQQHESNLDFATKIPYDLIRNWTLLTKSGDFLLQENDFKTLIEFHNANEEVSLHCKIPCVNDEISCTLNKQEYEKILANSKNAYELAQLWERRQECFDKNAHQFNEVLELVNKAYVPNGQHSSIAYWEMLSEYEDGYSKAKTLWHEILPLYKKLHMFVKARLYKYYNIASNSDLLPIYLLGSNFADDWSNIADIILPHPYLYAEVNLELKHKTVEDIFKAAEQTVHTIGLGSIKPVLSSGIFDFASCGPYIFSSCGSKQSQVLTCNNLDWNHYLNIYEASIDVALRSVDYQAYPRMQLRYSAIDEALKGFGSLLATADLYKNDLIAQNIFLPDVNDNYHRRNSILILTALRLFPKLSYYLIADTWRLQELRFSDGNSTKSWWNLRNGVQGVQGLTDMQPDFLADPFITSNKPFLSKFFGVFLQFQIWDYYQKYYSNDKETIAQSIGRDDNFKKFIKERPNKNWLELINQYYGFNDISSSSLLEYFKPLNEYLDKAPEEQVVLMVAPNPKRVNATKRPFVTEGFYIAVNTTRKQKEINTTNDNDEILTVPTQSRAFDVISIAISIGILFTVAVLVVLIVQTLKRKQRKLIENNKWYEPY